MTMTPFARKFALFMHIVFSAGWLGAVVPYLALAVAGLTSHDEQMMRAAHGSMELIGRFVIVPFGLAALLSGLVQSLGTRWGVLRYWWVVVKLVLTIIAVVILLKHMQMVSRVAQTTLSSASFRPELVHAGGGLLVLLVATTLSVFKPWGMTRYGRQRAPEVELRSRRREDVTPTRPPARVFADGRSPWGRIIGIHAIVLALLFAVLHITGMPHH